MNRFQIHTGSTQQHRVNARNAQHAIEVWLDLMGYESLNEAAEECYCEPHQIMAEYIGPA